MYWISGSRILWPMKHAIYEIPFDLSTKEAFASVSILKTLKRSHFVHMNKLNFNELKTANRFAKGSFGILIRIRGKEVRICVFFLTCLLSFHAKPYYSPVYGMASKVL